MWIQPWMAGSTAGLVGGPLVVFVVEQVIGARVADAGGRRGAILVTAAVVGAGLCGAGWWWFGTRTVWLAWCWAAIWGVGLVSADLRWRRLPFAVTVVWAGGGVVALGWAAIAEDSEARLVFAVTAAGIVGVFALAVHLAAPSHTGGGDTALYGAITVYLAWGGWSSLLRGLLVVSALAALVALGVAVSSRCLNSRFPAGPPLVAGALLNLLLM